VVVVGVGDHEPAAALRVSPTRGVPPIVGVGVVVKSIVEMVAVFALVRDTVV
jgi:hypothetical protein